MEPDAAASAQQSTRLFAWSLFVATLLGLAFLVYRAALPKPLPGIPYDEAEARSVFGSLPAIVAHMKQHGVAIPWLTGHNAKHNAPLIQFFLAPFGKPTLVLSDYQESQDILLRRTKEFDRSSASIRGVEGIIPHHQLAMRSTDSRFKGNKELVRDLMSPSFLHQSSATQIHEKSLALIELWSLKTKWAAGKPFAARQDIFDAAMDMINAAAFGFGDDLTIVKRQLPHFASGSVKFTENPDGSVDFSPIPVVPEIQAIQTVVHYLGSQIVSQFPRLTHAYNMLTNFELRRAIARKDEIIKDRIRMSAEKLNHGDEAQRSATDYMAQREHSIARKEGRNPDLFSRRTMDELFGYLVGGHETTSSSLSWALKLIADHQEVQEQLRQALKAAFPDAVSGSRYPTAAEITKANVPYLDAVIEECLRVGQPTPLVVREAMVDTTVLGHHVPKGTQLFISSAGPGYLSSPVQIPASARSASSKTMNRVGTWDSDDMHLFRPERWLKTSDGAEVAYDSQAGPFLSFGLGPRGCFGKRLAYLEMRIVLTLLIWTFRFQKLQGDLAKYDTLESVTVMPKHCYVALERI